MYKNCINCGGRQKKAFRYISSTYYKCVNCGLVSTYPIPTKKQIIAHYENQFRSGNYNLLKTNRKKYISVYKELADILIREAGKGKKDLKNFTILDAGCFTGDFLELFKSKGVNFFGIEIQKEAVEIARKKLKNKVVEGDILSYKFNKENYDAITMLGLIEHVTDPMKLLKKARALLKKEGILMIQTPNSGSLIAKIMSKYWPPFSPVEHIHIFSKDGLSETLKTLGFEVAFKKNHWKKLPVEYIFNNLKTFGPEFHKILSKIYPFLPETIKKMTIPAYIGEMIILARKK
ncbi:MAG: Methyltransferase type 12 [Candidatus Levybacteria bacterium GW2011_GWA1_39_11]|nr:MAG: Methyltransferase type 12 [Candidatus Levybacteria bacterium GW2011_GWA1_39_11]KKR27438.1 MAG: Methyltransferase type 11 [Microgenomates group bacterium GW2011_GWC1_39_7]